MMRTRRVQERLEGVNLSGTIVKHSAVFKIYFLNVRTSSDCGPADMNDTLVLWLQNRMTLKNKTQQISKMESKTEFLTCKINWVQGHLTEASDVKIICHFLQIYIYLFSFHPTLIISIANKTSQRHLLNSQLHTISLGKMTFDWLLFQRFQNKL